MSQMKIIPLIDASVRAEQHRHEAAVHDVVVLLEAQFSAIRYEAQLLKDAHVNITHNAVTQQRASRALYQLIYELQQRVDRLEAGGTPELNG